MTPEFWAILGVGVPLLGVGVTALVMLVGLNRDVASLRERMAKLEGAVGGFMRAFNAGDACGGG